MVPLIVSSHKPWVSNTLAFSELKKWLIFSQRDRLVQMPYDDSLNKQYESSN